MTAFAGGGVVWLTGVSGSGKTTVAGLLAERLRADGLDPVVLDGDRLRAIMPVALGYTQEDRRHMGRFYARLASEIAGQGHVVICATISLFHEVHAWNRAHVSNYLEVWLRAPLTELRKRADRYALWRGTNVVGADIEPEFPVEPDLVIDNYPPRTAAAAVARIRSALEQRPSQDEVLR